MGAYTDDVTAVISGVLFLVVAYFGSIEIRRWRDPDLREVISEPQKDRRRLMLCMLLLVLGMVFAGSFFPQHQSKLGAATEQLYYLFCMLIAVLVPAVAFVELRQSLKSNIAARREQKEALLQEVAAAERRVRQRAQDDAEDGATQSPSGENSDAGPGAS